MWNALTRLPSHLQELITLTREQNSLLRELVQLTSGKPALTPSSPRSDASGPSSRKRTAADVTVAVRLPADDQQRVQRESGAADPSESGPSAVPPPLIPPTPAA